MSGLTLVIPAEGRALRVPPSFYLLPPEGELVDLKNSYWKRALKDGDIAISKQPVAEAPPSKHVAKGDK